MTAHARPVERLTDEQLRARCSASRPGQHDEALELAASTTHPTAAMDRNSEVIEVIVTPRPCVARVYGEAPGREPRIRLWWASPDGLDARSWRACRAWSRTGIGLV